MIVRLLHANYKFKGPHSQASRELMSMKARFRRWALIYWPEAIREPR